ncbi:MULTISPECIES: hypothetical protein [Sphingomonas]|uniref:hypothetical protein n=1 Tax=Sphingomonas TaxID=13687 RepID=UPI000DEF2B96|nr:MULTISPECIES: hypothetical protein [Sphingomonas]
MSAADHQLDPHRRARDLMRQALAIIDEEIGDDILAARLNDCIELLEATTPKKAKIPRQPA